MAAFREGFIAFGVAAVLLRGAGGGASSGRAIAFHRVKGTHFRTASDLALFVLLASACGGWGPGFLRQFSGRDGSCAWPYRPWPLRPVWSYLAGVCGGLYFYLGRSAGSGGGDVRGHLAPNTAALGGRQGGFRCHPMRAVCGPLGKRPLFSATRAGIIPWVIIISSCS